MNSCKPRAASSILWLLITYIGPQHPKLGIRGERAKEPEGGAGSPTVHAPLRLQWVRLRSGSPLAPMAPHPTLGVCGGSYRFQLPPGRGGELGEAILLPHPLFLTSSKGRA